MAKKDFFYDSSNAVLAGCQKKLEKKIHSDELERQRLEGENWFHIGGKAFKLSRFFYIIIALYSLFFNLVFCLGWGLDILTGGIYKDSREKLAIILIITAALIVSLVLVWKKKIRIIPAACITVPASVASALVTWQWYTSPNGTDDIVKNIDNGIYTKYWVCNFPVVLLSVFAVVMLIIYVRDIKNENRILSNVIKSLYDAKVSRIEKETGEKAGMLTNEQWIEIIEEYVSDRPDSKQKRSLKHKNGRLSNFGE